MCILILSISETNVNFNQCTQCTRECHLKEVSVSEGCWNTKYKCMSYKNTTQNLLKGRGFFNAVQIIGFLQPRSHNFIDNETRAKQIIGCSAQNVCFSGKFKVQWFHFSCQETGYFIRYILTEKDTFFFHRKAFSRVHI